MKRTTLDTPGGGPLHGRRPSLGLRRLVPAAVLLGLFALPAHSQAQTRVPNSLRYQFASVGWPGARASASPS